MVLGSHYLDETVVASLITIPIAAASLAAYIEYSLTLIDGRINQKCEITTFATGGDFATLSTVEYNSFLKLLQNTRLSKEGVPAETPFIDAWFSQEDLDIMTRIASKTLRTIWIE